jgi:hypothetical protein
MVEGDRFILGVADHEYVQSHRLIQEIIIESDGRLTENDGGNQQNQEKKEASAHLNLLQMCEWTLHTKSISRQVGCQLTQDNRGQNYVRKMGGAALVTARLKRIGALGKVQRNPRIW